MLRSRSQHRLIWIALSGLLLILTALGRTTNHTDTAATLRAERSESIRNCFGTYDNEPRLPDEHVDVKSLISELVDQRANTYNWLIWHKTDDWEDLKKFLPLARKHHIKVWVTLVPPSESPPQYGTLYSEPFRLDYERWAVEIGKLSRKEPNLVAWSIDDFSSNLDFYTPAKLKTILDLAHQENPHLAFVPCCYYPKVDAAFVNNYGAILDGVLFPYLCESTHFNLDDSKQVEPEVHKMKALLGPSIPVVVDVYATPYSTLPNGSQPEYVEETMKRAHQAADGVLIYCHQQKKTSPVKYEIIKRLFHEWSKEASSK